MLSFVSRWLRLWRTYWGRCPYCGVEFVFKRRSSNLKTSYKVCPKGHFGVEDHGDGRVTYHDNQGGPISLLHTPRLRLLKKVDASEKITTKVVQTPHDRESTEVMEKDVEEDE